MIDQHAIAAPELSPPVDGGALCDRSSDRSLAFSALAHAFVAALNARDADALVALAHPRIVLRPTSLAGHRRTYHGHAGLRRWVAEIDATGADFEARIREIRPLRPSSFLVLSQLRVGDQLIADTAMIASVLEGKLIEGHGYVSDDGVLAHRGLVSHAHRWPL